jgi:NADPH:quinone reductase-like Zn-dependent oxidoreductase
MFVNGVTPNWRALERGRPRRRVALPTYPFQRSRHWPATLGTPANAAAATVASPEPEHSLLGQRLRSPLLKETVFQTTVSDRGPSFVRDHVVLGTPLFPATGYVEMAAAAGRTVLDRVEVEEITIEEPLPLAADAVRVLQIALSASEGGRARFDVFSRDATGSDAAEWSRHASGWVAATAADGAQRTESLEDVRRRCDVEVDRSGLYARLHAAGVEYGPTFQAIERIWAGTNEAVARLRRPAASPRLEVDTIHPGYLDAALQTLLAALPADMTTDGDVYLPIALRGVRHLGPVPGQVWSHATIRRPEAGDTETLTARLRWFDDDGRIVWEADSLTLKRARAEALRRQADRQLAEWLYELAWQPEEEVPAAPATMSGTWLVCSDGKGVGAALVRELGARGATCVVLESGTSVVQNGSATTVEPSDHARLADAVGGAIRTARDLKGVVHLWNLDTSVEETTTALDAAAAKGCGSLLAVVQALATGSGTQPRLWVATEGAVAVGSVPWPVQVGQAPAWGLARVAAIEQPQLRCSIIDLDPGDRRNSAARLLAEIAADDSESQIAHRGGRRFLARLVRQGREQAQNPRLAVPSGPSFLLTTSQRGSLDNLTIAAARRGDLGRRDVEIRVHASGLNFRDVLGALGMYPGEPGPMGGECAGRVVAVGAGVTDMRPGDDVMCLAGGGLGKYVVTPREAVVPLPERLTHEQGAGIPVAFLTAYYGLHHLAKIKRGDRVLVHAAAGGVGQAAIQIALSAGAEVYGTAGAAEKRAFVRSLGVRHVFSSRTADFRSTLLDLTNGDGVDIVVNSLIGPFIPESLAVLRPGGHFLELGKTELWSQQQVSQVNSGAVYQPFDLAEVMQRDLPTIAALFAAVTEGLLTGRLRPMPTRVFDFRDAVAAFRHMSQAAHVGKIVLSQRDMLDDDSNHPVIDPEASYLITGGCGGLGLEVAEWLASRGARHLVLTGRSAPGAAAQTTIDELRAAGPNVTVLLGDIASEADVQRLLARLAGTTPPLRGVIHAAGVLDDGVLTELTWQRFETVLAPKVRGAWLLDQLTRQHRLDFFVLFSSASAVLGAAGQANYAAANTFLDALAARRRVEGLPALSINWGPWREVGMAARPGAPAGQRAADRGIGGIDPGDGVRLLELLLKKPESNVIALPAEWETILRPFAPASEPSLLRALAAAERQTRDRREPRQPAGDLRAHLLSASPAERLSELRELVRERVALALGVADPGRLDFSLSFAKAGLDSLMALEVRNTLSSALGLSLSPAVLFEHPSIEAVAAHLAERIAADVDAESAAVTEPADLSSMSDEQVDEMLTRLLAESQGER